jgi:SAM-dependent methyltransferase
MKSFINALLIKYFRVTLFDIKQFVLASLGATISFGGRRVNYDTFFVGSNSLRTRLIRVYLNRRYYRASEADKHAMNRAYFWGGPAATRWHAQAGSGTDQEKFVRFREQIGKFVQAIAPATIVEIGCGNGTQIAKMMDQFRVPQRFVGLDLSADQITLCRQNWNNPKLEFYAADGVSWLQQNSVQRALIVTAGTLEYFTNMELKTFLRLANSLRCAIALLEPVGPLPDIRNFESVPRGNLAYSHNYDVLAAAAGFSVVHSEWAISRPGVYDVYLFAKT